MSDDLIHSIGSFRIIQLFSEEREQIKDRKVESE